MKKVVLPLSILLNVALISYIFLMETKSYERRESSAEQHERVDEIRIIDEKGQTVGPVNVVMLGNSITYQGDWQEVLNRKDVFNGGKPGWTTQQLSWVIKDFIVPNKPKLCFFKGGINDYTLGISTQRIYKNITMVLDSIYEVGTQPVYTTTLYQRTNSFRNRQIDSLNAMMENFCREKGYGFLDLRPYLCEDGDILKKYVVSDNTHLTPKAYPQWAKAMQPILGKYGLPTTK